jgi:stress response protein YsnF
MAATSEQRSTVVGAFEDRHQADTAISELRQAGFREDQIAVEEEARSSGGSESHRTTVTVTAESRYDEATAILRRHEAYDMRTTAHASRTAEGAERIEVREEELQAHKQLVEAGEVRVRKEVVTEHRTLEVPVQREEVVIERYALTGEHVEEIRIPVSEEQVTVEKRPVVK